jgi:hypothetical protein
MQSMFAVDVVCKIYKKKCKYFHKIVLLLKSVSGW